MLTRSGYRPLTYPNSRKYRDAGFHPATASAGSATISSRALLGRSGTTDVEITTGTFDGGVSSGTLSSVQVKGYDPGGAQLFTSTNNGLSTSTASFSYSNLPRGSGVQVKANVRSIGSSNTNVVIVSDVVHLRPDLIALRIDGPANAFVGLPVNFHAFIMERLGDVGARASCVLYVDGTAADRADGIWVDAGGVVDCAMTHSFSSVGTHALELRVENVRPGDYDDTNNSATASIQIVQPAEFRGLQLSANSIVDNSWTRFLYTNTTPEGIEETWDQTVSSQGQSQSGLMMGLIEHKLTFPVTMHGEMATNGTTITTLDVTLDTSEPAYWYPPEWGASCGTFFGATTDLFVCTFESGVLAGFSTIQYGWAGADVHYHSEAYVTYWDPTCANNLCERYVVDDRTDNSRPVVTFGPDFLTRLSIQGAVDAVPTAGMATVTLEPYSYDSDFSNCSTTPVTMPCSEGHAHGAGVVGSIVLGAWPE
ncbi:MAG TPA: hypothetical protein VIO57_05190 [Chloroflexota bacterium]|jgi:hypothetical protein